MLALAGAANVPIGLEILNDLLDVAAAVEKQLLDDGCGPIPSVAAFATVLAAELLPSKIRVNAIAPGFMLTTTMGVAELTDEQRAEFVEQGNASTPVG
ncbi:SDR family oxidoreductase [Streptomyces coeruleorubidus]|uniref:SDR family oxidoreductase n=1 Tax=Streptomyces coeruleorubidus TaxID=116188 RepID=UPI0037BB82E6